MKERLKKDYVSQKEETFTEMSSKVKGSVSKKGDDAYNKTEPDYLRGDIVNREEEWDKVDYPVPKGIILDDKKTRILRKYVDAAILSPKKKLKRQFWAFLRCESLTGIAIRANCSTQNIWMQFVKAISKIFDEMDQELTGTDSQLNMTPKKFKDFIILQKF